jgi:hypothetical protein
VSECRAPAEHDADATTPRPAGLLRQTEEHKVERVQERLEDYNRRNYADYFKAGAYTRSLQSLTSGHSGHIAHINAQLEHLRDTSTGQFGLCGGQSGLKLGGKGQSELKLSGNGNECKPLLQGDGQGHLRR